jgi:hypothetical protein
MLTPSGLNVRRHGTRAGWSTIFVLRVCNRVSEGFIGASLTCGNVVRLYQNDRRLARLAGLRQWPPRRPTAHRAVGGVYAA